MTKISLIYFQHEDMCYSDWCYYARVNGKDGQVGGSCQSQVEASLAAASMAGANFE